MIRLFAGIDLPEDVKEHIYTLRGGVHGAKWVNKENLHVTLRFIGNIDETDAEYLHANFCRIQARAFNLALTQVGFFATGSQIRHLWTGVSNFNDLDFLHDKIDTIVQRHNLGADTHKFHAHVTIAKLRGASEEDVFKFLAYNNLFRTREFRVDKITLFSSHPHHDGIGSYYRAEAEYPLY